MEKEVICGIYKITSPTGRVYIGESKNIYKRWSGYKYMKDNRQHKLTNSFKKHGVKNHIFEILEECDFDELLCRERFWQDEFDAIGKKGMNCFLTVCGDKKKEYNAEDKRLRQLNWHNSKVVVNFETGEEYISLAEACRVLNLDYPLENLRVSDKANTSLFYQKIKPFEKNITSLPKAINFKNKKEYTNLKVACEELNLNYLKEYEKVRKKSYTAKFYYEGEFFERTNIHVSFETGEEYTGLVEACKETGEDYIIQAYSIACKYSTAKFYVKGKKFERKVAKELKKVICFKTGEIFDNMSIACKEKGLEYDIERTSTSNKSKKATFYYEGEYFEGKPTNLIGVRSKLTGIEYRSINKACVMENLKSKIERRLLESNSELASLEIIKE